MTDLSMTIAPKSDQLNADDLIAGPRTITITRVSANEGSPEQPISVFFEGDNGKPFKPCKSMRRVMVHVWGPKGDEYPGRSMTLYRDPKVKFGGLEVGGIRISHMSHIDCEQIMALTASKAKRTPYTVKPLKVAQKTPETPNEPDAPEPIEFRSPIDGKSYRVKPELAAEKAREMSNKLIVDGDWQKLEAFAGTNDWLETLCPDLAQIIPNEIERLKGLVDA